MPDSKASVKSMQNHQSACSLDQTAASYRVKLLLWRWNSLVIAFRWDPGVCPFSANSAVTPIRRKIPLLRHLALVTTACCHPPLGFWSSDITHLCTSRDDFTLPCSYKGSCRHYLHLPLCRSCSSHFPWMQRFLYSNIGTRKRHFIALALKLLPPPCKKVNFFLRGPVQQNNFCLAKWNTTQQ